MRKILVSLAMAASLAVGGFALVHSALAHSSKIGAIEIVHPYARTTAPSQRTGVVFFTLKNGGPADRVIAAKAPDSIAEKTELHTHLHDNGVMQMRQVAEIPLAAGATVELKPGGLHVMLIGLKAPLVAQQRFPLDLTFANAGTVTLDVVVEAIGTKPADHTH